MFRRILLIAYRWGRQVDRSQLLNDPIASLSVALDGRQALIWTAMPGIIESVDFTTMTCVVQPAIQGSVTDENNDQTIVDLPLLLDVPILFPSANGFTITFPLAAGDEVLVIIASRCIDAWWQLGGVQVPLEARMHDLSDGFAIPGPKSQPNIIPDISSTSLQIRNDAGTSYFEIGADGKINLVCPEGLFVTGDIEVDGEVTANGISLSTHVHPVSTAPGTTGVPIP